MKTCIACSMPLADPENLGAETKDGPACVHCVTSDGKIRSCEEIFEGGIEFFLSITTDSDRSLAERLTRRNMNSLSYWQENGSNCLEGEEASDEEHKAMLAKL